ncbi:hypothetical protein ACXJJ3_30930 [Kribbella sp. WER1]
MGERLPEAWMVAWHRDRRVEFAARRRWLLLPCLLYLALSGNMLLHLPDMLTRPGWRYFGYLAIAAYAGIVGFIVWTAVTQRPYLVVDHNGLHCGRRSILWRDVGSVGLLRGPARQLPVHPKNVWAKDFVITRQHVNDVESFRTWLEELLAQQRQEEQVD